MSGTMRTALQYIYSIGIFVSVLVTAYLLLDQTGNANFQVRPAQLSTAHEEASSVDPALLDLINIENDLGKLPQATPAPKKPLSRAPTDRRNP